MRHELLFLVVSIILVLQIPLQPYYVLVYNKEITTEISKTLKLVQLCIAVLFVWGRHCVFFRRPSYSMQDIYLMLFIVSCYFSKSVFTFITIALAFTIWDIDCYCSPAIDSDVRRIKFTKLKGFFLSLLILNYFLDIPIQTHSIVPYFPTVHLFIIMTIRCLLAYVNEFVVFSDTLTFMVYTIPIASVESWMFSPSDFALFGSLNVVNLAFYFVIFSISNVSHLFYVNPLSYSIYINPYLICGLVTFATLACNNQTPFFFIIQFMKCIPVFSASKYMLPRSMVNYSNEFNDLNISQMELLLYHKRRNKWKLDMFTSIIYSLLIMNYVLYKDDLYVSLSSES